MSNNRINHQPAFLLASRPWSESSLQIEIFSRDYGRVVMLARSARRRQSELRGVLVPFVPLQLSWYGNNELKTLHRAEWIGGWQQPQNQALFSALYVNELVLKLTAREDPLPRIHAAMHTVLQSIASGEHLSALRYFEWSLLRTLGIAPDISRDNQGQAIINHERYWLRAEHAPVLLMQAQLSAQEDGIIVHGYTLNALTTQSLTEQPEWHTEAIRLTRLLLDFRLPEDILSRRILKQLQQYTG
ncbi:DNA repair protein RecO [Snodgrassella alvi]|jgi:DNA repair protein RecO (recombination protein O)|uniref:DNA repair protein RecO n=1 Tax=Snodgrassella alvi TaxID=1196083 RepID=UPI000C1F7C01|nr:DNA repair protein RecO [Snodgrassella alvi]PIT24666.1 DNA repair protein RecO [Snodgrassella alvi]PIT43265.1 DNA repair protein RecO [Snodgrassella alvi]